MVNPWAVGRKFLCILCFEYIGKLGVVSRNRCRRVRWNGVELGVDNGGEFRNVDDGIQDDSIAFRIDASCR